MARDDQLIENLRARTWPGDCEAGPAPRDGHARQQEADESIGLRSCNSLHGQSRTGAGMLRCSYQMRITDPGCTWCADRDEDQLAEAGG